MRHETVICVGYPERMKSITLLRHAKSSWEYAELSDFERPLNERGRADAPRMAARAAGELPSASRLISSPATRAITTARIFAGPLGFEFDALRIEPRLYNATRKTLLELIHALENTAGHVVLVGHNPGFSELAHTLGKCPFDEMPTCAVAHFALKVKLWRDVAPGCGELLHFLFPKDGKN